MDGTKQGHHRTDRAGGPARNNDQREFLKQRLKKSRARTSPAVSIPRTARTGPLPQSFAQQRIWFLQELAPGNPFYNIPAAVPLNGPISVEALEAALNTIVERHESLRTVFGRMDGVPCQTVKPHQPMKLALVDISDMGLRAAQQHLDSIATVEAEAPFDLANGPVIRFQLVRLAAQRHVLLLTVHHIAADGWSMGILFREFAETYEAIQTGRAPDLPSLRLQYGDFAKWQRDTISGASLESLLGYWRGKLAGARDLPLITDRPRPTMASFRGDFLDVNFDRVTTDAVRALARAHDCTLFQTMLTAYKVVLSRFAGATDVVVGAPIANRAHSGLEPLIGFFVNSLALRTDLSGDPAFVDLLARVRQTTVEAYAHQDLPFERLVEDLRPDRDLSRNPLFQVSFQIQNAPGIAENATSGGQDFRRIARSSAILDMALSLWETPNGLVGGIEYSTDLFERETVQCIADALRLVLKTAVADAQTRWSQFPLLEPRQDKHYRHLLQGPRTAAAPMALNALFAQSAKAHARRTALVDDEGTLSFAQIDAMSDRIATAFHVAGIRQGDVIGLALDRGRNFVAIMLAAVKIGAAYLPIDPDAPPMRLEAMARLAAPSIVVIEDDAEAYPHGASGRMGELHAFAQSCEPFAQAVQIDPGDPCYVLFTSGSTGRPKAVEVSHRALSNHMQWMQRAFDAVPGDRILQRTPTHFDASIWEFWLPLLTGAQLCLPTPFHAADGQALHSAMEGFQPTIVQCVPTLLPHLLSSGALERSAPGVRILCCGGEPLTAGLTDRLRKAFPAARIINLYGPTETTIDATWHVANPENGDPMPIGRPIDNCSILVVDDNGALCPPNMRGEILIGGPPVANGYLGQPALTQERFVTLPGASTTCFLSGDLGWYNTQGTIYCAGRKDRQVKLRGNRIELGEVEAVLEQHDAIDQAAVIVHEDQGDATLAAFLTLRDGPDNDALRDEVESGAVDDWEGLYSVVYAADDDTPQDARDDFTGWISSFDGKPIPPDEMRHWADETADRIAALRPRGVFEIGVGSGLILSRLASDKVDYVGCDLSAPVIERLMTWVAKTRTGQIRLEVAKAQDAANIPIGACDTLVLNSVVQYLPSAAHLRDVLAENAARMPKDARIFVGDVRPLGLLRAFHAATELARASKDATARELRKRVEAAIAQEKELLFDPAYFRRLAEVAPALSADVEIRLKNGADGNELFDYRYDVAMRCGTARPPAPIDWINWRGGGMDLAGLEQAIRSFDGTIAVAGIPNRRVAQAVALSHLIRDSAPELGRDELVAQARKTAATGVHPGEVAALARAHGLTAEALPNRDHPDLFDLVIHDGDMDAFSIDAAQPGKDPGGMALSTEPTLRALSARLAPVLHAYLADHLPPAMCPTRLTVLDHMPKLSNGKLDYGALADHLPHEPVRSTQFEAPADALEQLIADIFAAVLGVTQVGAGDHFFASLGGHSLLATQAVARLREIFGDDLPLRMLFEHPTPSGLAAQMALENTEAGMIAEQYAAMKDLDEASLDALLAQSEGNADE